MNKRNLLFIILVILVAALVALGVYFCWQENNRKMTKNDSNLIGGQKDTHGCLISAGYSWCEAKQECLEAWEESGVLEPSENDLESIKQAFMYKYSKNADEVQIQIDKYDGNFARGGVKFAMAGQPGEGGIFLAYKKDNIWELAFDGNGMYNCEELEKYSFPVVMTPDCATEESGDVNGNNQLANPASTYCQEQGGQIEIRERKIGQYGVCLFEDNRQCEEWAMFRGQCPVGGVKITGYVTDAEAYCVITGGQVENPGSVTPMCKRTDGTLCTAQANMDGECPDPNNSEPNAENREE